MLTKYAAAMLVAVWCCCVNAQTAPESPVRTAALTLLAQLEAPNTTCGPDDTICISRVTNAKLTAAIEGLKSILIVDEQRSGMIADMQQRIDVRGGIINDLQAIDKNSQKIDTNQQANAALYEGIIRDDKVKIGKLEDKLESCQSRQKWIAGLSFGFGLYVGNKVGSGQNLNPFSNFQQSSVQGYPLSFYEQTNTEKKLRQMLKQ